MSFFEDIYREPIAEELEAFFKEVMSEILGSKDAVHWLRRSDLISFWASRFERFLGFCVHSDIDEQEKPLLLSQKSHSSLQYYPLKKCANILISWKLPKMMQYHIKYETASFFYLTRDGLMTIIMFKEKQEI